MIRAIAALFVGLATAMLAVTLIGTLGLAVYPLPEDLDRTDPVAMAAYIERMPTGALLFIGASWWMGALIGGLGACSMAKENPWFFTVVVGGAMAYLATKTLNAYEYPGWFHGVGVFGIVAAVVVAVVLAKRLGFDNPTRSPLGKGA